MEDAKAARSVRVWDMTERGGMPEGVTGHPQMPGRSWRAVKASGDGKPVGPDRLLEKEVGRIDIGASEEEKEFSSSLGFHYICKLAQKWAHTVWSLMMTVLIKMENA